MKKAILMILMMSSVVNAKVSDFNSLIDENTAAQKQLHTEVRGGVDQTRMALKDPKDSTVIVDNSNESMNVPTSKNMLRFKKEISEQQAPDKKQQNRLATEFKSADLEF